MTPGNGYLYYATAQDTATFTYPNISSLSSNRKSLVAESILAQKDAQNGIARSDYQTNLTLVAQLQAADVALDETTIRCYVGSECRGFGEVMYVADKDAYFYFVTICGDVEGEKLSFSLQTAADETIQIRERLPYSGNQRYGSIDNPVLFTLGSDMQTLSAYPIPFKTELTLAYTLDEESTGTIDFCIMDITGSVLATFSKTHTKAGYYTLSLDNKIASLASGVYFVSMTTASGKQVVKVAKTK
jgi:hypothetical protein